MGGYRGVRRGLLTALIVGLCALVGRVAATSPLGRHLEAVLVDSGMRLRHEPRLAPWGLYHPPAVDPGIVIVGIDRKTYETLREPTLFWNRHLARVIAAIGAAQPRVLGLDRIQLVGAAAAPVQVPMLVEGDEALAQALADCPSAVLAYAVRPAAGARGAAPEHGGRIPLRGGDPDVTGVAEQSFFHSVVPPDALGMTNLIVDSDGVIRWHAWLRTWRQSGSSTAVATPTFAFALLTHALGVSLRPEDVVPGQPLHLGACTIDWDAACTTRIHYAGPGGQDVDGAGRTFRYISFADALEHARRDDRAWFERELGHRIVLLGESDTLVHTEDLKLTPYSGATAGSAAGAGQGQMATARTPGVEVHANILNTVLTRASLRDATPGEAAACLAGFLLLAALLATWVPVRAGIVALLTGCLGYLWLAAWMLGCHLVVLPLVAPLSAGLSCAGLLLVVRVLVVESHAREVRSVFARYVHPKVVEEIVQAPERVGLGGKKIEATVMFTDLNDFTTLSHTMEPTEVVALLNAYFERMTALIFKHGGTIQAFLGDGLMIVFNAPLPQPDHAMRAVAAACDMMADMRAWMQERQRQGEAVFWMKVGIHTGEVVVGNIGSTQSMAYTAIGDTCNVASRTMDATKRVGADILVGRRTFELVQASVARQAPAVPSEGPCPPDIVEPLMLPGQPARVLRCRAHDGVALKGIEKPVTLYELAVEGAERPASLAPPVVKGAEHPSIPVVKGAEHPSQERGGTPEPPPHEQGQETRP